MTKAILFDLDNTLYNYDYAHKKAMQETYKEIKKHIKIPYAKFNKLYKTSRAEIHRELVGTASAHNRILYFQRLIEKTHNTIKPRIILKLYDVYWNSLLNNMKLFSNVLNILKYCKKHNIKTAIVSNLTTRIQLRKLRKLKISKYIDVLVTSEETGSEKPHSIMYLLALNKLNEMPKDVVMVGDDSYSDIEGANFVGLSTVLLNNKKLNNKLSNNKNLKIPKEDYLKPNYCIENLIELNEIIKKIEQNNIVHDGYIKFNCILKKTKPINKQKVKELNKYRQKLYNKNLIGAYKNKIGFGNISIKDQKTFIITGSATGNIKTLNNKHFSKINNYDIKKNKLNCSGTIKASSESLTHAAIYECSKDIKAVIHIHNLKMWKKYINKLPTTCELATYGTPEIANEIKRLYNQTNFKQKQIAILGGHKEGIIAFGKSLKEAYDVVMKYF